MKRTIAKFDSEAQMCGLFIDIVTGQVANGYWRAKPMGWKTYAETGGFDILLARETDGFQIGIEAKLRLNDDVIMQILEKGHSAAYPGPDCRAVLVPRGTGNALHRMMCARAGVQIITITGEPGGGDRLMEPDLPHDRDNWQGHWPEMLPTQRVALPEFVPDVAAGSKSPIQLTAWKIKAIKIACIMERRGWVCRTDFKHIQIDHRRYLDGQWIVPVDGAWRRGPYWPDLRAQHPRNFIEIDAVYEKWAPPEPAGTYGRLL